MIPMVMRLVISDVNAKGGNINTNLWLPLFLLWLLILPLIIIILVVWVILSLLAWVSPIMKRLVKIIEAGAVVIWNISGLRVDIRGSESRFVLHF